MFQSIKDEFERNKNSIKNTLISACTSVLVVVTVIPVGIQAGIAVESKYFPVVSDFTVSRLEMTDEGNTNISGKYYRNRDCVLLHAEWELITKDGLSEIPIPRYNTTVTDRDVGWNEFKDIILFIRPQDFKTTVSGTAYYRCHPFWITVTTFYDARKNNV